MKRQTAVILLILLTISSVSGAQNTSEQESSGVLSSLPDIQIDSAETYNNSAGEANKDRPTLSWIIILGIAFLGVVLYSFDIDPKWIMFTLGMIGIVYLLSYFGVIQA